MSDKAKDGSEFEDDGQLDESYDELDRGLNVNGSRRRNTREDSKDGGYQLKNVLKLPRATTYSTQAVYDQIHAGDIDLSPEYQRDVVWPDTKQIGLIDSILRNFYIPPVIFVTHQYEDGSETKTCIDGKQRLTSIQRYGPVHGWRDSSRLFAQITRQRPLVGNDTLRPLFLKDDWRVAPIEFVMMCLLISVEKDKLPLREIAEGIGEMRVKTRAEHTDIRSNARVAKTMFDFIGGRCQVNGGTSGSKRKRGLSADEDDESQRKIKEQKPDAVAASTARSSRVPPPPRLGFTGTFSSSVAPGPSSTASRTSAPSSSTPSVIQPPRPMQADRLQAVRDAKSNAAELGAPSGSRGDYVTNPGQTPLSFIEV
ncbi:hypothetical protein M404DRAFT_9735 [Pisolithus tinctorius Marx 270]|uniref:GmrSD restriction endonucleases N-terminal domain-containing protein n=1 Tax=Pisolithus tinctorius Marx 270 TaxID=870435 RepID=A0A0C3P5B3_PISTI|nr:hypothetical protein M404DRAFT_9735 [Pisolithus tinctorius Marx 270]